MNGARFFHGIDKKTTQVAPSELEFSITPRDVSARRHLDAAQANILTLLNGIPGVRWQYNDPGAQAVIVVLPADAVKRAIAILLPDYMVDPNAGLRHL